MLSRMFISSKEQHPLSILVAAGLGHSVAIAAPQNVSWRGLEVSMMDNSLA